MKVSNSPILVSVVMITYAHEAYIKQAIEGVLNQVIDCELELIIANDNSPDNTDAIVNGLIANHPKGSWIKYFQHYENKGMQKNFVWALNQAKGDFIAICDGDDYWIDNFKIKKQIDFMINNIDVIICGTYCDKLTNDSLERCLLPNELTYFFSFKDVITSNTIPTLTYVFRNNKLNYNFILDYPFGDLPLLMELTKNGNQIVKLPFVSGVYRYHGKGANSGSSEYKNYISFMRIKYDFCKLNKLYFAKRFLYKYYLNIILQQIKHFFKGRFVRFNSNLIIESISLIIKTFVFK